LPHRIGKIDQLHAEFKNIMQRGQTMVKAKRLLSTHHDEQITEYKELEYLN